LARGGAYVGHVELKRRGHAWGAAARPRQGLGLYGISTGGGVA